MPPPQPSVCAVAGAVLRGAKLCGPGLLVAVSSAADLGGAQLAGMDLRNVPLRGAALEGGRWHRVCVLVLILIACLFLTVQVVSSVVQG